MIPCHVIDADKLRSNFGGQEETVEIHDVSKEFLCGSPLTTCTMRTTRDDRMSRGKCPNGWSKDWCGVAGLKKNDLWTEIAGAARYCAGTQRCVSFEIQAMTGISCPWAIVATSCLPTAARQVVVFRHGSVAPCRATWARARVRATFGWDVRDLFLTTCCVHLAPFCSFVPRLGFLRWSKTKLSAEVRTRVGDRNVLDGRGGGVLFTKVLWGGWLLPACRVVFSHEEFTPSLRMVWISRGGKWW